MPQVLNLPGPGPLIQQPHGSASGVARDLATAITGAGSVTAGLTLAEALRAVIAGTGTLSPKLTENALALRAAITGAGSLAADLRITRALRTVITGGGTVVAGLKLAELLQAAVSGQGVLTAALTVTSSGVVVGLLDTRDHQLYIASVF